MYNMVKQNIAIICLDKSLSRTTAQLVADQLEMRFFDMRELFDFDHKPRLFKDIITEQGNKYYRAKEVSILKYAATFENILLNVDSDCLYKKDLLNNLGESFLIVYLHVSSSLIYNVLQKEDYSCYKEKVMYAISRDQIAKRVEYARKSADIEVNVSSCSGFKASAEVIRAIQRYYGL